MIALNYENLPEAYGLTNTGVICYFNSLLQVLGSCTSIQCIHFKDKNLLETAFHKYVNMLKNNNIDPNISSEIIKILSNEKLNFGNGQESASEALVFLMDCINNVCLTSLFISRIKCKITCNNCQKTSDETKDYSIIINLFHDQKVTEQNILSYFNKVDDYTCNYCNIKGGIRYYNLAMLSEILVICFNVYFSKKKHEFPETLTFPGKENPINYKLVGQIEHTGSLHGGHYWARVLRKDDVYLCNDSTFNKSKFIPTDNTYIIIYHHC